MKSWGRALPSAVQTLVLAAAAVALVACGGDGASQRCVGGDYLADVPSEGFDLSVCLVDGDPDAFGLFDRSATVSVVPTFGSDGYRLVVQVPAFPSLRAIDEDLTSNTLALPLTLGGLTASVVSAEVSEVNATLVLAVYSLLPRPVAASSFVDYGFWTVAVTNPTSARIAAEHRGPWFMPREVDSDGAPIVHAPPSADAGYSGVVLLSQVDFTRQTYGTANVVAAEFSFGIGDKTLRGRSQTLVYTSTPSLPFDVLEFEGSVDDDGSVTGAVTVPGRPNVSGRFEGRMAGPGGEEFVARVTLHADVATRVRADAIVALRKTVP